MSPHPVMVGNEIWRTTEHLFQAARFFPHTQKEIRDAIRECKSPMGAKMIAKSHASKMCVVPRSDNDVRQMSWILSIKLEQHPTLLTELIGTGDAMLIEDVTARPSESGLFWGSGPGLRFARKPARMVWFERLGKHMDGVERNLPSPSRN
jgi:predicted NAD-dependent protein-ADP-ribosyltransferase YbiA (DUF1768 family)